MKSKSYQNHISNYLAQLVTRYPHRSVGSVGNINAVDFFAEKSRESGCEIIRQEFNCIDWNSGDVFLSTEESELFQALPSPWSLGCNCLGELVAVDKLSGLKKGVLKEKILLLHGDIAAEQLMPKNFVFYNPAEHQEIIKLLEEKHPAAIITATGKNPELAGALYPFPLFEDGDFNIPSVYMTEEEGIRLLNQKGKRIHLRFDAERIPSKGSNIIARKGNPENKKIVLTAHIDTKPNTPGALDNASSVVIMLIIMMILRDYKPDYCLEFVAMNGEDHYAASGEMKYLSENMANPEKVLLNINMDGVGFRGVKTGYTIWGGNDYILKQLLDTFAGQKNFTAIDPWYQGDHMLFVMQGIPALTFTSENLRFILAEIAHTEKDTIDKIDLAKLEEVANHLSAALKKIVI